jgi:glycosyltransferase involved in cell wall biosynthesis
MIADPVKIYVALPIMNELENLGNFIQCCRDQNFQNFKLVVCVNQPDDWWEMENKVTVCHDNSLAVEYLETINDIQIEIIDKSSKGFGWKGKEFGVGWARKTVMDLINSQASGKDMIISLDADTKFNPDYFQSVADTFQQHLDAVALSVPYYHRLTGDEEKDRAILRYEIYMRYYAINLWRINSPYSFTAIGSAMALPAWAYRAIGGMTPHKSGEDFYFLQKLRKYGEVLTWNPEKVYPAARYSDRVFFGTGPAMIKGSRGDWKSYPIYPYAFFDEVKQLYDLFPTLFDRDVPTPLDHFIKRKFRSSNIWQPLRENFKTPENFVRACHHKLDGLRILQYLKERNEVSNLPDEENLLSWFEKFYPEKLHEGSFDLQKLVFSSSSVSEMDSIRNMLARIEEGYQKDKIRRMNAFNQ